MLALLNYLHGRKPIRICILKGKGPETNKAETALQVFTFSNTQNGNRRCGAVLINKHKAWGFTL